MSVFPLETAGLIQLRLDAPGVEIAVSLTVGEAQDLGEQLVNAAIEVASA